MERETKERKSYEYRWFDYIPAIGAITFSYRNLPSDLRGEIKGLKEDIGATVSLVTIFSYNFVLWNIYEKIQTGTSMIEKLVNSM